MSSKTNWQISTVCCRFNALRAATAGIAKPLNNGRDCNFGHCKRFALLFMFCYIKPCCLLKVNTAFRQHDRIEVKAKSSLIFRLPGALLNSATKITHSKIPANFIDSPGRTWERTDFLLFHHPRTRTIESHF